MSSGSAPHRYRDSTRPEMLAYVPKETRQVLEVGCHTGHFGRAIKSRCGAIVWGVEPNPETAAIAAEGLDRVFNGFFDVGLALPERFFDLITFTDVLEHMPDPWGALRLASEKLTLDGMVLISVPNLRHIDNLVHILRERDFNYEPEGVRDRTHLRFFTKKSAPRLFDGTGLKMTFLDGINESAWACSFPRRLAFRLFPAYFSDTKHIQFAMAGRLSTHDAIAR